MVSRTGPVQGNLYTIFYCAWRYGWRWWSAMQEIKAFAFVVVVFYSKAFWPLKWKRQRKWMPPCHNRTLAIIYPSFVELRWAARTLFVGLSCRNPICAWFQKKSFQARLIWLPSVENTCHVSVRILLTHNSTSYKKNLLRSLLYSALEDVSFLLVSFDNNWFLQDRVRWKQVHLGQLLKLMQDMVYHLLREW